MKNALLALLIVSCAAGVYAAVKPDPVSLPCVGLAAASLVEAQPAEPAPDPSPAPEPIAATWLDYTSAYNATQETGDPLVVMFGSEGCWPCKDLKAALDADRVDGVTYCYVDIVQEPDVAKNFGYVPQNMSVPEVVVFHTEESGPRSHRFIGSGAKAAVCRAVHVAKRLNKAVRSVLRRAAQPVVKAVDFVQERQPVRRVLRRAFCPSCR